MKLKGIFGLLLFTLISFEVVAQTTDLARVEYFYLPYSNSKNTVSRFRALVQAPIPLDKEKKEIFVIGLEYRHVDIDINDKHDVVAFDNNLVTTTQSMYGFLGYVWKGKNEWRYGIRAGIKLESDLHGSPISDDFIYEIGAYAIKDKRRNLSEGEKPYRLIFGLIYSTVPGRWYPLPLINYYKKFSRNWTYTLGIPKTNIRHYLNDSHKDGIQVFATIENIYANIQQGFVPKSPSYNPNQKLAESIQHTSGVIGIGYEHFFTEQLLLYTYVAQSVYSNFRLEDGDGNKIYKINTANSPYFRVGLKFKY